MKRITLVCAAGMSTSLLVSKMNTAAIKSVSNVKIRAVPEGDFQKYADDTDILLLGPQVAYTLDKMKAQFEPKGIKVSVIDSTDYAKMDGEKVLKQALAL
ncbi:PTS sugar transporter subunit IIB [Caproiciproducens galactitolivorans]|uniref:Lichenan-specific phosphotransferase enzyme IIB component n=1 Tax=Caproiciproducens galactitolivorans TaxID=642589 RepID=A0A4Z0XZ52_9FIRM|nr:PTS sugar transporter subunit IIB [Caproiciproducens galactitolivorans]QEY35178.1 PTS sugar transporter subunit IIB [Caproiciproducens galactitolivorans]TGJ76869.1 lichenan-specific phosphotransferase enzyme IIB component [Caproiciproducens galactitolivorans]